MPDTQLSVRDRFYEAKIETELANAEKLRQEGLAFSAEHKLKGAQAREALAKARQAEFQAENSRINTQANLRQEKIVLAGNHHHYQFEFHASVYDESVEACLGQMAVWHRQDPECPMHIVFNSPGGSVIDGMHLFDQITAYSKRPWDTRDLPKGTHDTKITVRGYAASMAGILLQAADTRVIGPESYLMVHEVSTFASGKIGEIKDEVELLDKMSKRVTEIFVRRSDGNMTPAKFKKLWDRKDAWLTSSEALDLGFVDEIG